MPETNGKPEDTDAEKLLRRLVTATDAKCDSLQNYTKNLLQAANEARWYLMHKDACEFVEETGCLCYDKAVRVSYGIPCCEDHAKIRDHSMR